MSSPKMKRDILGLEPKGITYVKSNYSNTKDLIVAKEVVHYKDGTFERRIRLRENFERSFYVTKKEARNHTQKKSSELLDNLIEYRTTQSDMQGRVARALNFETGGPKTYLKDLAKSPYLYGADVAPTACFKYEYIKRWPNLSTPNLVATLDIETDVVRGTGEIILLTITLGDKVNVYVLDRFLEDTKDVHDAVAKCSKQYISELMEKRGFTPNLIFLSSPGQIVKQAIQTLHEWSPDIVVIWNAIFDMPRLEKALLEDGIDPAVVFSDPKVPKEYQHFKIHYGNNKETTASGVKKTKSNEEIWNWFAFPAGFQILDAMCVYNSIRFGAKESSYALDAILRKEKVGSKLRIKGTENYHGLRWHEVMQTRFKIEYLVYNIVDCVAMEELDEKTTDVRMVISELASHSDFRNLNSGPKRLIDRMHFWYLNLPEPQVIGSTPSEFDETHDKFVIDHRNIIVTLPAYMLTPTDYDRIEDAPGHRTLIYKECADLDITSTYPTASILLNISPETVVFEVGKIEGCTAIRRLAFGINLTNSRGNSLLLAAEYLKAPSPDAFLEAFLDECEKTA